MYKIQLFVCDENYHLFQDFRYRQIFLLEFLFIDCLKLLLSVKKSPKSWRTGYCAVTGLLDKIQSNSIEFNPILCSTETGLD